MKKGRSLELLVEALERQMSGNDDLLIESPKRLKDVETGRLREHDVVLTSKQSHHTISIAIECRDRSKPVGVPDIEGFVKKCQSTGINKGLIVSSSGFYKSATEKAQKNDIRCIELSDIDRTDFLTPDASVLVHTKKFLMAVYTPVVTEDPSVDINNFKVIDPEGNRITNEILGSNLAAVSNKLPHGRFGEEITSDLYFECPGCFLSNGCSDQDIPIVGIQVQTTYVCTTEESALNSKSYADSTEGEVLAQVATAKIELNGEPRKLALISSKEGTTLELLKKQP